MDPELLPTQSKCQDTPRTSPQTSGMEFNFDGFYVAFFFSVARNISRLYYSVKTREKMVFTAMTTTMEKNSVRHIEVVAQ